jgi:hypothetical protein
MSMRMPTPTINVESSISFPSVMGRAYAPFPASADMFHCARAASAALAGSSTVGVVACALGASGTVYVGFSVDLWNDLKAQYAASRWQFVENLAYHMGVPAKSIVVVDPKVADAIIAAVKDMPRPNNGCAEKRVLTKMMEQHDAMTGIGVAEHPIGSNPGLLSKYQGLFSASATYYVPCDSCKAAFPVYETALSQGREWEWEGSSFELAGMMSEGTWRRTGEGVVLEGAFGDGGLQSEYVAAVAPGAGGMQVTTYTHARPSNRVNFLADFAAGRLNIGAGHAFATLADQAHNNLRGPNDPLAVSYEWTVTYVTPPSNPPGIINVAPANPIWYLHAHGLVTPQGTQFTNLHVKATPAGGIAYALQPADANTLHLVVHL